MNRIWSLPCPKCKTDDRLGFAVPPLMRINYLYGCKSCKLYGAQGNTSEEAEQNWNKWVDDVGHKYVRER